MTSEPTVSVHSSVSSGGSSGVSSGNISSAGMNAYSCSTMRWTVMSPMRVTSAMADVLCCMKRHHDKPRCRGKHK